jgi:hypothetical protein
MILTVIKFIYQYKSIISLKKIPLSNNELYFSSCLIKSFTYLLLAYFLFLHIFLYLTGLQNYYFEFL